MINKSERSIKELFQKYSDDEYLTTKLYHYLNHQLPSLLDQIKEARQKHVERTKYMSDVQEKFMNCFLAQNQLFYHASNDKYFEYDSNYNETNEDIILYKILTEITKEKNPLLLPWKHKTKIQLLKRIKDNSILKSIPDSKTIQSVIECLVPTFFASRNEAKYFLTVIGDSIFKKTSHIHMISPSARNFLKEINNSCLFYFNCQCTQTFKFKWHEKREESQCRMIRFSQFDRGSLAPTLLLNLLCISCHYSVRYGDADQYLSRCNDEELQKAVLTLTRVDADKMINIFAEQYIQVVDQKDGISWRHMNYLWKDFLQTHRFPLNMYQTQCKKMLTHIFAKNYDAVLDHFKGCESSQIPMVQKFLQFWNETIVPEEGTELEAGEIAYLFRTWSKKKPTLNENKILDILNYYLPELEILNQKYIMHIRSSMWNKELEIETILSLHQDTERVNNISLYNMYSYYCKCKGKDGLKVSKTFFEKYVNQNHDVVDSVLYFSRVL